ncbi:hypothetical protein OG921_22375 [Aldersonia sp. NBC_00410]|uniref:hypothetical protein n=1 Tax=Aldersonia sp. NBC_00410 TaxID=2975954 RepID=UPI0022523E74|nr:hypothetical protein [Aldersonia sp. NBC_00410]MCX5045919.1 hypothetical protein [Aldersonia sp. NBC_00410]
MFTAAALVPSPPIVVPELNGADASPSEPLRTAALDAVATLGARWTVVGVGETECELSASAVGTFRGFGADVRVALSDGADGQVDARLPLAALIAGWLRERAGQHAVATARIVAADTSPVYCAELGRQLRREMDADSAAHGLLVVADGATTLTAKAPGAFDPRAEPAQRELDDAIAAGDCATLAELDPVVCAELGIGGRAAFQVLAGAFDVAPRRVESRYRDAPFGVGYHVAVWRP